MTKYQTGAIESSRHYTMSVVDGDIENESVILLSGMTVNLTTTYRTLWGEDALYVFPSSSSIMTLSSSSANDAFGGTGANLVLVSGLNSDYEEISEVVQLNGQTPVSTVLSFFRVNLLTVIKAGSVESADGIVYIGTGTVSTGKPANVFSSVLSGSFLAEQLIYTVPKGATLYTIISFFSADSNKVTKFKPTLSVPSDLGSPLGVSTLTGSFVPFIIQGQVTIETLGIQSSPEKSDITIEALQTSGSGDTAAAYFQNILKRT